VKSANIRSLWLSAAAALNKTPEFAVENSGNQGASRSDFASSPQNQQQNKGWNVDWPSIPPSASFPPINLCFDSPSPT